jgi:histidine triad (HIT) family protein
MPDEEQQQCIFCHIASGKIPAKKVYSDDKVVAVLDINPGAPGHILLMPKEHATIMPQMSEDLVAHIGMVAKQLSHAVIRALKVEGTSIFVANGVAAGQRAPHFLLHVIPRKPDDGIALQPPIIKIDQKTSDAVFDKLAASVAKQFGKEAPKPRAETPKAPEKEDKPKEEKKEAPKKSKLDEIAEFLAGGK